jgi:cytoskeleton protein RodZ
MLLSNERVKRGLSLQEVADRLKLSRKQLEAIENDEYDKLPGPAFARGFVRNYAKLLGLDVALLNASLDAHLPMPPVNPPVADTAPAAPAPAASSRSPAVNPTLIKGALALLVLLLAAGVGYRLLTQGASTPATPPLATPAVESALPQAALNPEPASSAAPVSAAPSVDSKPAELKPEPAKLEALAVAPVKPAEVKPAEAKPTSTDTSTAQAAVSDTGAGELVLNAREKAWVSVIDAKGKKLLYGQISGEKRLGGGTPPYKLIIGNAPQVELNYKGQAVPLADKTKGSTAKLELQ